ncbi:MAG: hypothetical protein AABY30_06830 [Candidatus Thermoplasmatota archaeon]
MKAKVVLAGAPRVGKTSLIRRYVLGEFSERYKETLGAIVYKREAIVSLGTHDVEVTMTIWDVIGQSEAGDPLRNVDLYGAQGVLAVCDVMDPGTVPPLRRRIAAAVRAAGEIPVQILMNKFDLGPSEEAKGAVLRAGLERGIPCYATSAKSGDNVVAAFEDLARRIVERSLLPLKGPLDNVDRKILVESAAEALSPDEVAKAEHIPVIFAEARLERLRHLGLVQLAGLGLDNRGRPRLSYGRTHKPIEPALVTAA